MFQVAAPHALEGIVFAPARCKNRIVDHWFGIVLLLDR